MKTAMISHPEHTSDLQELTHSPLKWQREGRMLTVSGYGTKIPTPYVMNYQGRKRRIYADQYSNAPHTYIMIGGEKVSVLL